MFALLMLLLCVILHTMWSGKNLQLICILPFGILCLSAIRMVFVKILLAVCTVYVGGYYGLSESGLYVFRKLCSSVLLQSIVMLCVDCGDNG